jgi:hypothetical protein
MTLLTTIPPLPAKNVTPFALPTQSEAKPAPTTKEAWQAITATALKLMREEHTLELAATPLADSALVMAEFLEGEIISPAARGRALHTVLAWAIAELRPAGVDPSSPEPPLDQTVAPAWRLYKILHHFYLEHWTIERIAEALALAPTSIFNLRPKAVAALADLLAIAMQDETLLAARRQATIARRYQQLPPSAQTLLRVVAVFRLPCPLSFAAEAAQVTPTTVADLVQHRLLQVDESSRNLHLPQAIRTYLQWQWQPDEQRQWHGKAAEYYQQQRNFLEAARHWQRAQAPEMAATLLLTQQQTLINQGNLDELAALLAALHATEVTASTWARLQLLTGQVAELLANFAEATAAYTAALQSTAAATMTPGETIPEAATLATTEAEAHYRLAKILEYRNLDEALEHYTRGIALLERRHQDLSLLVKLYIHRSWILIQRQDLAQADASLQRAKLLIDPQNRQDWADLYNAAGELSYREQRFAQAVQERMQAWLAAKALNDLERMGKIAYNLGRDYTELRQFDQALFYLEQSRQLAQKVGNSNLEAGCRQIIGDCYFYQERYTEALQAYQDAYRLYAELGNDLWLTGVCFDLTVGYAVTQQWSAAQRYYAEGIAAARTLSQSANQDDSLLFLKKFKALAHQYPRLTATPTLLNPRQERALAHVHHHGEISNRVYRTINAVENKTAASDLKELVEQGLLQKVGQGAAVVYCLPSQSTAMPTPIDEQVTPRQRQVLAHLQQHGAISNRDYRELTGVGNKTAAADLQALVTLGLVTQVGKGPATVYTLC